MSEWLIRLGRLERCVVGRGGGLFPLVRHYRDIVGPSLRIRSTCAVGP